MFGLGKVIAGGLRKVLSDAVTKGVMGYSRSGLAKVMPGWINKAVIDSANRLLRNAASAKWWSRSIRMFRKRFLAQTGAIGSMLQKAGVTNWMTKGMAAFNLDPRSPREFARDMKRYDMQIADLNRQRLFQIKKAGQVGSELLKVPVDVSKYPTSEAKLDAMAQSLTAMKVGIGEIRSTVAQNSMMIDNTQQDVNSRSGRIEQVLLGANEQTIQTILVSSQEGRDATQGVIASSTQTTISEITGHIDAIEETKKKEQEERRKNHWLPKAINRLLMLVEIILDFPGMMLRMAIKLVVGLVLFLMAKFKFVAKLVYYIVKRVYEFVAGGIKMIWNLITGVYHGILAYLGWIAGNWLDAINAAIDWIPGVKEPWPEGEDNIRTKVHAFTNDHKNSLIEDMQDFGEGFMDFSGINSAVDFVNAEILGKNLSEGKAPETNDPDVSDSESNGELSQTDKDKAKVEKENFPSTNSAKKDGGSATATTKQTSGKLADKGNAGSDGSNIKVENTNDTSYFAGASWLLDKNSAEQRAKDAETRLATKEDLMEAATGIMQNIQVTNNNVSTSSAQTQAVAAAKPPVKQEINWRKTSDAVFGPNTGV